SSESVLIAESKLRDGAEYTESQLRDAVARIQRLPFVVDTSFRLEKGSARGRYVLVITIVETRPLFVSFRALHEAIDTNRIVFAGRDPVTGAPIVREEKQLFRHNEDFTTVGARWFVGARGLVHGAVDLRGADRFSLGYTQYGLFGTRASVSAIVQYREYAFDFPAVFGAAGRRTTSFTDHLSYDLTAAVPLYGNHGLRAAWHREQYPYTNSETVPTDPFGPGRLVIRRFNYDRGEAAWIYDSTDDSLFPTRGTYLKAGLSAQKTIRFTPGPAGRTYDPGYRWEEEIVSRAARHWALTPAQSVAASVDAVTRGDREDQEYTVRAGYAADLLPRRMAQRVGDFRFELEAERVFLQYDEASSYGTARAGLALRNTWGVARLDFRYIGWRQRP
ncbi:MAG TPA: hypothetical protein VF698_09750, partial [Thermoanaerobaculia bacterium]